jgi:septal ring factor EnvC (AmiA/AmiB activator)
MSFLHDAVATLLRGVVLAGGASLAFGYVCAYLVPSSPKKTTLAQALAENSQLQTEKTTLAQSLAQANEQHLTLTQQLAQARQTLQTTQAQLAQEQQALATAQADLKHLRQGVRGVINGSLDLVEKSYRWYQGYLQNRREKQSLPVVQVES